MHSAASKDCKAFVFNHVFSNLEMFLNILEGKYSLWANLTPFYKKGLEPTCAT